MLGKYIYADFCTGVFRVIYKDHGVWVNRFVTTQDPFAYSSFGEDINGELYIANLGAGEILRVVDSSAMPVLRKSASFMEIQNSNNVTLFPNPNNGEFRVQLDATERETYNIKVVNTAGQEIFSEKKISSEGLNEWTFSSDKFTKGFYILYLSTSDAIMSKKFSVE